MMSLFGPLSWSPNVPIWFVSYFRAEANGELLHPLKHWSELPLQVTEFPTGSNGRGHNG